MPDPAIAPARPAPQPRDLSGWKTAKLLTPPGALSFPDLFHPRAAAEGARPKFGAGLLIDKKMLAENEQAKRLLDKIWQTTLIAGADKLGTQFIRKEDSGAVKPLFDTPGFRDGDDPDAKYTGNAGRWILRASANADFPPTVLGPDGAPIPEDRRGELVFPGANAAMIIGFYPYQKSGNAGVTFNLLAVKLLGGGQRLGGGGISATDAAAMFESVPALPAPEPGQGAEYALGDQRPGGAPRHDALTGKDSSGDDIPFDLTAGDVGALPAAASEGAALEDELAALAAGD